MKRLFLILFLGVGSLFFTRSAQGQVEPVSTGLNYWYSATSITTNPDGTVSALNNLVHADQKAIYSPTGQYGGCERFSAGFDGAPAVDFNGDDVFRIQYKNPESATTTAYTKGTYIFGIKTRSTLNTFRPIYKLANAQEGVSLFLDNDKLVFVCYGLNGAATDFNRLEYTVITETSYVVTAQFDASTQFMELFVNGVSVARKSIAFDAIDLSIDHHGMIGGQLNGGTWRTTATNTITTAAGYYGYIANALLYNNTVLSTNERLQTEAYVRNGSTLAGPASPNDCFACIKGDQLQPVVRYETTTSVSSFLTDLSGNGLNSGAVSALPTYTANAIGTRSALHFAAGKEIQIPSTMLLDKGSRNEERTYNLVIKPTDIITRQFVYRQGDEYRGVNIFIDNSRLYFTFFNSAGSPTVWTRSTVSYVLTDTRALIITISDKIGGAYIGVNGNALGGIPATFTGRPVLGWSKGYALIGGNLSSSTYDGTSIYSMEAPFTGYVSEFSIYNKAFNAEELALLHNYQGTKYNIALNQNIDYYRWQEFFAGSVGGLNAKVSASCSDELLFKTKTILSNTFLHIGNNKEVTTSLLVGDHTFSSSTFTVPANVTRSKRTWRVDKSQPGSPYPSFGGSQLLDFSVKVTSFPVSTILPHQKPVLIVDADGDFSKEAKIYTLTKDVSNTFYIADDITVNAGDHISLGVINVYEYSSTYPYTTQFIYQTHSGTSSNLITSNGIKIKALNGTGNYNGLGVAVNNQSGLAFAVAPAIPALSCKWKITHYGNVGPVQLTWTPSDIGLTTPLGTSEEYVLAYEVNSLTYSTTTDYLRFVLIDGLYKIATLDLPSSTYEFTVLKRAKSALVQAKRPLAVLKEKEEEISDMSKGLMELYGKDVYQNGDQNQYDVENPQCVKSVKKAYLYLTFNTGKNYLFGNTAFSTQVKVSVSAKTTVEAGPGLDLGVFTLTLDQSKPEQLQVIDVTDYVNGYPYEVFEIKVTEYTASANTTINEALELKAELIKEKKVLVPQITDPIITSQSAVIAASNKSCTFTWTNPYCDPYTYQFQLLRLFNGSTFTIPTHKDDLINAELDWSKALTLETSQQNLTLTLAEGTGYYVWRVRPVGNYYPGEAANNQNWGGWNTDHIALAAPLNIIGPSADVSAYQGALFYYSQFDEDKNFIYNRVFTEDTKVHEGISYANGLQQINQSQAKVNSNGSSGQIVVSESVYDFSGRASLQSMSAPDESDNELGYRSSTLMKGTDKYNAFNFDADTKLTTPDPIDNGLINLYYSDLNTDPQIPDAENYPYSRTLYDNDGISRTTEQSGAGKLHSIGNKTASFEYSTASDLELLRIFGDEAPKGNTVLKTKTTDQNNVSSITYTDLSGKVIATTLVKNDKPSNLEELEGAKTIHVVDSLNNNVALGDKGVTATKKYTFSETTDVTVSLKVTPYIIQAACTTFCSTCAYNAVIKVVDDKTNTVVANEVIAIDGHEVACSTEAGAAVNKTIQIADIPTGTYSITKTIVLDETKASVYAQAVRDKVDADLQAFVTTHVMSYVNEEKFKEMADHLKALYSDQSSLPLGYTMSVSSSPAYVAGRDLKTGDEVTIGPSCCAVRIPITIPELEPCEQYEIDLTVMSAELARAKFAQTLADKYDAAKTNAFPISAHSELGVYTKDNVKNLFANMLAEPYYSCDEIWQAWLAQIILAESKMVNPYSPSEGYTDLLNKATTELNGDFSSVNVAAALADASHPVMVFLNELKRKDHLNGFLETQSDELRTHAYKFFYYNRGSSGPGAGTAAKVCEQRYCSNPAVTADVCTATACVPQKIAGEEGGYTLKYTYTSSTLVLNQANDQVIMDFYYCISTAMPVSTSAPQIAQQVDDYYKNVLAKKTELETTCRTSCDDKREEFMTSLRKLYDSDNNGSMVNSAGETISERDLCCTADQMVQYCKDQCYLSVVRERCEGTPNYAGEPVKLISVGTEEEVNKIQAILGGTFEVQDAAVAACSTDYQQVETCKNAVGIYHLNGSADRTDYAHPDDPTYQLTYSANSFSAGRTSVSGQAMNTPETFAMCSTEPGNRDITDAVTVSAWVNMKYEVTPGTTNIKTIVKKMDGTSGFHLYTKNGYAYFDVKSSGNTFSSGASIYNLKIEGNNKTIDPFIQDKAWHLVTGVLREGNKVEIWIDGQLQKGTQTLVPVSSLSTTASLQISALMGSGEESFEGSIDEVYLYSCALSKADILGQFNETQTSDLAVETNLVSLFSCGNQPPDKLWDSFADNLSGIGTCRGMNKVSNGAVWSYGMKYSGNSGWPFLDIVDKEGNHQGITFYNYNQARLTGMVQASDGTYLLAGFYKANMTNYDNCFVININTAGQIIWQNGYTIGPTQTAYSINEESGRVFEKNGHIYFVCTSMTYLSTASVKIVELSLSGAVLSNNTYSVSSPTDYNYNNQKNIKYLFDGNYVYVAGTFSIVKINLINHSVVWERNTSQDGDPIKISAIQLVENGQQILIAGHTDYYNNVYHKIGIRKINTLDGLNGLGSSGSYEWNKTWVATNDGGIGPDPNAHDMEYNITHLSNDRMVIMGFYYSNTSDYRAFTIIVSSTGSITPINYPNSPSTVLGTRLGDYKPLAFTEVADGFLFYGVNGLNDPSYLIRNKFLIKFNAAFQIEWQRLTPLQSSNSVTPVANEQDYMITVYTGVYLFQLENKTILIGNDNYWGDRESDPDLNYSFAISNSLIYSDWWFLNLGYPVTCTPHPVCVKWIPPTTVVVDPPTDPPLTPPTKKEILKEHVTQFVYGQIGECFSSNLSAVYNEYMSQCKGNIVEECVVSYDMTLGHFTLYYYDRAGNLVKTVPPAGVVLVDVDPAHIEDARQVHPDHQLVTKYKYNSLGQLIGQTTPDGGTTSFRYNKLGMLRFSQNAEQASSLQSVKKYSYTKYDLLGRTIEVGQADLQGGESFTMISAEDFGLTSFPTLNTREETFTVYNDAATHINYLGQGQEYLRNRVSYSFTKGMDGNKSISYFSYDPHGNVKWIVQELPGIGKSTVGYDYDLISNKVLKVKLNENRSDQFFHRYFYDSDNRITSVETSSNGYLWDRDAAYSYYKHGPLRRTELGEDHVQGLDYTYTLQGWLKALNAPTFTASDDPGQDGVGSSVFQKDEYGFVLGYYGASPGFNGDFKRTGSIFNAPLAGTATSAGLASNKPLYNGNITSWTTRINAEASGYQVTGNAYTYDFLNRILSSKFYTQTGSNAFALSQDYSTGYSYDANGNLETLTRKAKDGLLIDNLTYHYNTTPVGEETKLSNNRLRSVSDPVGVHGDDLADQSNLDNYLYDEIGNLTSDEKENSLISWNVYGKVSEVKQKVASVSGKPELRFVYDAMGNRIEKEENKVPYTAGLVAQHLPENLVTTYYVRDASGNVMAMYQRRNAPLTGKPNYYTATYTIKEVPLYGSSRLGIQDERDEDVIVATKIFHKDDYYKVNFEFNQVDQKTELNNWLTSSSTIDELGTSKISSVNLHAIDFNTDVPLPQAIGNIQNFAGVEGKDVSVAESDNGQVLFYTTTLKKHWGKSNVLLLFDANGNIMPNSGGILADAGARTVIVQSPVTTQQYLLFTRNAVDHKLYYHVIDLDLRGNGATPSVKQGDVKVKNQAMDADNTYGTHLVAIEDRSAHKAYIYATHFRAPDDAEVTIGTTELTVFEVSNSGTSLVKAPSKLCTEIASWDDLGQSQLQVSANGKKLTMINHKENLGWFGVQQTEAIVFNLGTNHRLSSNLIVDARIVPVGISYPYQSVDFSSDSRFMYYTQQRLTEKPAFYTMDRFDFRNNVPSTDLFSSVLAQVQRSKLGKVYAYQNPNRWNAYKETTTGVTETSAADDLTFSYLATGTITNSLPLQNRIVYRLTEQAPLLFSRRVGKKNYELSDHLGNVTVVVSDELEAATGSYVNKAHVETFTNYYPFGMIMPGRQLNGDEYRYGYNGKEKDDEFKGSGNSYDYGARMYDPRIGRWMSLDPLMKKYPYLSGYSAFANDPINVLDPDGRDLIKVVIQTKSKYIKGQLELVVDREIADKVKALVQYAIDNDIYVHFNSDFRSSEEQGNVQSTGLTPAKVGSSRHEGGFALDFQLYKDNDGKTIISKEKMAKEGDADFISKAKELGFRWGGDFTKKDGVHIDAWPAGEKSKYGYDSWTDAYNENQNDNNYEEDIFNYNKGDASQASSSSESVSSIERGASESSGWSRVTEFFKDVDNALDGNSSGPDGH